ncbi:TetR/AcrR family transcriptional regulator [Lampropedia aestuarii]|uniref:TetR/AcrR family transcriptional regulator n=1 Tax=Lampropedia aestuarii TaxID=2562762 RepID=A0A4S5BIC3_9BURK|nr:TetR/AcrR family transcriptional regulator [Lampropedia aestuarii]MDH5859057.1 helix-turn-helix domain containing protein [Lampropedia aestuarii]THJ32164.1 TetR/AcrR family transcriptional regulator [Lampropedia aestuarii]
MSIFNKLSFKDQAFRLRETAILDATTQLFANKGFDLMTMDDVALAVGISKPSLYKHFKSKDDLAAAAMLRLLHEAEGFLDGLDQGLGPTATLSALLEWAMRVRLAGGLPFLPSTSPHIRSMLTRNIRYVAAAIKLNSRLKKIVQQGQKAGELRKELPADVILYSFYARTCDPAVEYLRLYAKMSDDDIVKHMLSVCFSGLTS